MTDYLYVPFPDDGELGAYMSDMQVNHDIGRAATTGLVVLRSNLSIWDNPAWDGNAVGHFADKQKAGPLGRFTRGRRVLSVVGASDVLYVTGHGAGTGNPTIIGAAMTKVRPDSSDLHGVRTMGVTTLARRMRKEGLSTSVRNIAVIICDSGIDGGPTATTRDCFAQILARELGNLGYGRVEVVGYTGTVAAMGRPVDVGQVTAGGTTYSLGHRARVFDARGNEII